PVRRSNRPQIRNTHRRLSITRVAVNRAFFIFRHGISESNGFHAASGALNTHAAGSGIAYGTDCGTGISHWKRPKCLRNSENVTLSLHYTTISAELNCAQARIRQVRHMSSLRPFPLLSDPAHAVRPRRREASR